MGTRPPARADQLGGERLGVAGAERLEHPAGAQAGGDQVGGPADRLGLGVDQPVEDGPDGSRVPLGTDHEVAPLRGLVPVDGLGGAPEGRVGAFVGALRDGDVEQVEHDQLRVPGGQRVRPEGGRPGWR